MMDVLCCKITIGDANPSNPMEIKDAIEITEVQSIEINETSSFISAPFSVAETILRAYSDRTMKGKPIVMRAKPEGGARDPRKKAPARREAFMGKGRSRRRKQWEDDYQPYGRDTRGDDDGRYSFPDRKRSGRKKRK